MLAGILAVAIGRQTIRPFAAAAGALVAGVVAAVVMLVFSDQAFASIPSSGTSWRPGLGFWLLVAAGLLGLAGAALAVLRRHTAR